MCAYGRIPRFDRAVQPSGPFRLLFAQRIGRLCQPYPSACAAGKLVRKRRAQEHSGISPASASLCSGRVSDRTPCRTEAGSGDAVESIYALKPDPLREEGILGLDAGPRNGRCLHMGCPAGTKDSSRLSWCNFDPYPIVLHTQIGGGSFRMVPNFRSDLQ